MHLALPPVIAGLSTQLCLPRIYLSDAQRRNVARVARLMYCLHSTWAGGGMADYHSIIAKAIQRRLGGGFMNVRVPHSVRKCVAHTRRFIGQKLRPQRCLWKRPLKPLKRRRCVNRTPSWQRSPLPPSAPVFQSRPARRRTKRAKCVLLSRRFGLVSSAEPMTALHVVAKRYPTIARMAPMALDALG
jgi:hypothetical protein